MFSPLSRGVSYVKSSMQPSVRTINIVKQQDRRVYMRISSGSTDLSYCIVSRNTAGQVLWSLSGWSDGPGCAIEDRRLP